MKQHKIKSLAAIALVALLGGCAKTNPNPLDPLEGMNREIYGFNRAVDKGVIRPIAYGYYKYTPKPLQTGVHNFFSNFNTITTVANDLLQFQFAYATHDFARLMINSTVGLLGFLDVAQTLGLLSHQEDFGQTLYAWGFHRAEYLVLPFLGPSTSREAMGLAVDVFALSAWPFIQPDHTRYTLMALELLDIRANLLPNEKVLETVGVDEYAFVRNAYLQRRNYLANYTPGQDETEDSDPFANEDWLNDDPGTIKTTDKATDSNPYSDTDPFANADWLNEDTSSNKASTTPK